MRVSGPAMFGLDNRRRPRNRPSTVADLREGEDLHATSQRTVTTAIWEAIALCQMCPMAMCGMTIARETKTSFRAESNSVLESATQAHSTKQMVMTVLPPTNEPQLCPSMDQQILTVAENAGGRVKGKSRNGTCPSSYRQPKSTIELTS